MLFALSTPAQVDREMGVPAFNQSPPEVIARAKAVVEANAGLETPWRVVMAYEFAWSNTIPDGLTLVAADEICRDWRELRYVGVLSGTDREGEAFAEEVRVAVMIQRPLPLTGGLSTFSRKSLVGASNFDTVAPEPQVG